MADVRSAIRTALVSLFTGDAAMKAFFPNGVVNVSYRPTRRAMTLPRITFFDFGERADETVPLWDRSLQLDFWSGDLDVAEAMAQRALELLDHDGLTLAGDVGLTARIHVTSDLDATLEDADLARKTVRVRLMAYDYVKTYTKN